MTCAYCGSEMETKSSSTDREQYTHAADSVRHIKCPNCGSEVIDYLSGRNRQGATREHLVRAEEVIPEGYMCVVTHENTIVFSGKESDMNKRTAIEKCKEHADGEPWYIVTGKKKFEVWGNQYRSEVDDAGNYRINPN